MSIPADRRSRKRLATRQQISDAATRLFLERGFDAVTVDDIAAAADVGRMTVFNHFPRKEDMFFDRDEEAREGVRQALINRQNGESPIEALRAHAHQLIATGSPYAEFSIRSRGYVETVRGSESLMSRARAMRDELENFLATALSESVAHKSVGASDKLAAAVLVATWTLAFTEAHRLFRETGDTERAKAVFLEIVDSGSHAANAVFV